MWDVCLIYQLRMGYLPFEEGFNYIGGSDNRWIWWFYKRIGVSCHRLTGYYVVGLKLMSLGSEVG